MRKHLQKTTAEEGKVLDSACWYPEQQKASEQERIVAEAIPEPIVYGESIAKDKLASTKRLTLSDIDDTLYCRARAKQLAVVVPQARRCIEESGASGVITMCPQSLCVSSQDLEQLRCDGLDIPNPQCVLGEDERFTYRPTEQLDRCRDLLGWDTILACGTASLIRQRDGRYRHDRAYEERLGRNWRGEIFADCLYPLQQKHPERQILGALMPTEFMDNFLHRRSDAPPAPHRIQLQWRGAAGLRERVEVEELIRARADELWGPRSAKLAITDESDPERHIYSAHLTPLEGTKIGVINNCLRGLRHASGVAWRDMRVDFFGNAITDLRGGFYAGYDPDVSRDSKLEEVSMTFVLVGKSAVMPYLAGDKRWQLFAGQDLSWARRRLEPTKKPGVYLFRADDEPRFGHYFRHRRIIIGDIVFPGTEGPETILAYYDSGMHNHEW